MTTNEIFVLTVKVDGKNTRVQFGCTSMIEKALFESADAGTFVSLRMVNIDKLPFRSDAELLRGGKFLARVFS